MIDFLKHLLLAYPAAVYVIVFVAAFLESFAFVGIFIPGTVIVIASGFIAENWPLLVDVRGVFMLSGLGAFFGSVASYLIGRYFGPPLFAEQGVFKNRRNLFIRAQKYFASRGGKSVLTGHFLGPIRSLVSLVAGMTEMPYLSFIPYTIIGVGLWTFLYAGVGYIFGASWEAVQLWGTRLTIFIFGFIGVLLLNWFLGRFLIHYERQVRLFFWSIGRSIGRALQENEYISAFTSRHPRLMSFVGERLSPYHVFGLALTLGLTLAVIIGGYFIDLVLAMMHQGSLAALDQRILALVSFIHDPIVNKIMIYVTHINGVPLIGFVVVLSLFLILLRRQIFRAVVLVSGLIITYELHLVLKFIFDRPRPEPSQALLTLTDASFPSGHAALSMTFFGYLAYIILGEVLSWRTKILVILGSVFAIATVGFSRIFLGVHWPSDVLGGYLLGAWSLVIMITTVRLWETAHPHFVEALSRGRRWLNIIVIAIAVIFSIAGYVGYVKFHPLNTVVVDSVEILPRQVVSVIDASILNLTPKTTEMLNGQTQAPITLVIVGSRAQLEKTFTQAGWSVADPINLNTIWQTIKTSLADESYKTAPLSPSFYGGRVQDISVEKETEADSVRERHHARFWLAPVTLRDGRGVWVGTASFDKGIALSPVLKFPTHIISPDIDSERDFIKDDLAKTGRVLKQEIWEISEAAIGRNSGGDLFFSDGRVYALWLTH